MGFRSVAFNPLSLWDDDPAREISEGSPCSPRLRRKARRKLRAASIAACDPSSPVTPLLVVGKAAARKRPSALDLRSCREDMRSVAKASLEAGADATMIVRVVRGCRACAMCVGI
jgi:hypothetical protein